MPIGASSSPSGIVPEMRCSFPFQADPSKPVVNPPFLAPVPELPPVALEPLTNNSIFDNEPRISIIRTACKGNYTTSTCPNVSQETIDGMGEHCIMDAFAFDPNGTSTGPEIAAGNELTSLCREAQCSKCLPFQLCTNGLCVNTTGSCGGGCANNGVCSASGQCQCTGVWSGTYCTVAIPQLRK